MIHELPNSEWLAFRALMLKRYPHELGCFECRQMRSKLAALHFEFGS